MGLGQIVQDLERHLGTSVYNGVGIGLAEDNLQGSSSASLQWHLMIYLFHKRKQGGRESHSAAQ